MPPKIVTVAAVERGEVELTQPLVATVEPVKRSAVATEEAGLVDKREFEEGQQVDQDKPLAVLKTDLLQTERKATTAAREAAAAALTRATYELGNAERELKRVTNMFEGGAATKKELDDATTALQVAQSAQLSAQSTLNQRNAELARLDLLIEKATIRAPFRGIIARRNVEVGQWLDKGAMVAEIVQMDPLYVRVYVPENLIGKVRKDDTAKVTVDALRGESFAATVDQILPEADPASRTFPVKLLVQNKDLRLRPGLFARATLTSRTGGLLVPRDAIHTEGRQSTVVVVREGKAVLVPVTRGAESGGKVVVTGELREGEAVVTRGNEQLRGGEDLIVQNPLPATTQSSSR